MGFESKSLDSFKIASKIHFLDGEMAYSFISLVNPKL